MEKLVKVVDPNNLAPKGFEAQLLMCLEFLPFNLDMVIPICVEERNVESNGSAWNCVDYYNGKLQMVIKLYSKEIYANVKYNRMNYWLFIALHELAHIYYRKEQPESVLYDSERECNTIAHNTLHEYKQRYKKGLT